MFKDASSIKAVKLRVSHKGDCCKFWHLGHRINSSFLASGMFRSHLVAVLALLLLTVKKKGGKMGLGYDDMCILEEKY